MGNIINHISTEDAELISKGVGYPYNLMYNMFLSNPRRIDSLHDFWRESLQKEIDFCINKCGYESVEKAVSLLKDSDSNATKEIVSVGIKILSRYSKIIFKNNEYCVELEYKADPKEIKMLNNNDIYSAKQLMKKENRKLMIESGFDSGRISYLIGEINKKYPDIEKKLEANEKRKEKIKSMKSAKQLEEEIIINALIKLDGREDISSDEIVSIANRIFKMKKEDSKKYVTKKSVDAIREFGYVVGKIKNGIYFIHKFVPTKKEITAEEKIPAGISISKTSEYAYNVCASNWFKKCNLSPEEVDKMSGDDLLVSLAVANCDNAREIVESIGKHISEKKYDHLTQRVLDSAGISGKEAENMGFEKLVGTLTSNGVSFTAASVTARAVTGGSHWGMVPASPVTVPTIPVVSENNSEEKREESNDIETKKHDSNKEDKNMENNNAATNNEIMKPVDFKISCTCPKCNEEIVISPKFFRAHSKMYCMGCGQLLKIG